VTPNVDGPVRVGGGTTASSSWSYYAIYQIQAGMDLSSFQPPDSCTSIDINSVRLSVDWLDPASSGMAPATYYDDNTPAGVAIDGSPDSVASSPADTWKQVSGGWGSVVQVADISLGGGTVTNYYKDDQAVDTNDTGDQRSFGDAGFRVDNPAGQVQFELTTFVLGAGQPNVGATYRDYQAHPLQATAVAQAYEPPCAPTGVKFDWSPHPVYVGVTDTFNASVSAGQPPFTYTWTFGDDGSTATGNPVTHTFDLSGTFPVSLTVSNACSTTLPVVRPILVSEPGSAYLVCLPLVVRAFP
jgi:PKD repeat protein